MSSHNHVRRPFQRRLVSSLLSITQCLFPKDHSQMDPLAVSTAPSDLSSTDKVTVHTLPDGVLLEIFKFYVDGAHRVDGWYTLVHVCQRWRFITFAAPSYLGLRLVCTETTPVKEMLSIWPPIPIVVSGRGREASLRKGANNIVAALGHNNRLCEIDLREVPSSLLQRIVAVMMKPSPALTSLVLCTNDESAPIVPDLFLGGSAPRLHTLRLDNIPFPALRKLLLSAPDLVYLHLWNIPHSGYTSPEAMATCLATMTRLQRLYLGFRSPQSHPDRESQRPLPLMRTALPALTYVFFRGCSEYLENLVATLDTPILDDINITFFNQLVFDIPQLLQFLCRAENFKALDRANVVFRSDSVRVTLSKQTRTTHNAALALGILCGASDRQLSALAQVCRFSLPLLYKLKRLDIREGQDRRPQWQSGVGNGQWLELLSLFAAAKTLYLSKEMASHVAPVLDELARGSVLDVLPTLQNILLEGPERPYGPAEDAIFQFLTARQQSGYPVTFRHQ